MRKIEIQQSGTSSYFTAENEKQMYKLAAEFIKHLRGGEVVALQGDLGAGKTTFVKGIAQALGIKKDVTSPTFVLMKVYPVKHEAIKSLVHIDAYRLSSGDELLSLGVTDFISKKDTITFIEWPERVHDILPISTIWIKIEHGE